MCKSAFPRLMGYPETTSNHEIKLPAKRPAVVWWYRWGVYSGCDSCGELSGNVSTHLCIV